MNNTIIESYQNATVATNNCVVKINILGSFKSYEADGKDYKLFKFKPEFQPANQAWNLNSLSIGELSIWHEMKRASAFIGIYEDDNYYFSFKKFIAGKYFSVDLTYIKI